LGQSPQVTGRVGRAYYEDHFQTVTALNKSTFEYLVEYTIMNTAPSDLIFDRVKENWSAAGRAGLSVSKTKPNEPWRLPLGTTQTFVAETQDNTIQLLHDARGVSIEFSITLFRGDSAVLGPFVAELPKLETLQHIRDQDLLILLHSCAPLQEELKALAVQQRQDMVALKFRQL
jgi:hypothetical protein